MLASMKASDLMVRALENEGVEYIFGIPGEENLDFLNSLKDSSIKLILTRHEQAAGFMAATYGRLTGKPGVALSTLGPGATNFSTASSYALLGGMPVVFLTGQKPIKKSKQGRFQILDVVQAMTPLTKLSKQIVDPNKIPHLIREAFRLASFEKPGPVLLELPEDIAHEEVDRKPFPVTEYFPPASSQKAIKKAARMLEDAKRPLALVASEANRHKTSKALRNFIEKTGLYFFSTQMGKGVVDENHERCLGTAALSSGDYIHEAIEGADLILNIGHDVSEKPPFFMNEGGIPVIHMSFSAAKMDDVYFPQHEVVGCMNANLLLLSEETKISKHWDMEFFKKIEKTIEDHVFSKNDDERFPNIPQRIVSDVRHAMPRDGIISLDNGMYKIWFARNYPAQEPNTVLLDNALASMGAGLPGAIAAKMINPSKDVMAVCGDGGFMMNSQELETAVRLKLDLICLILSDKAYGMIKWKQTAMDFPDFGLDFKNPDFVAYANAYGASGHRIQKTGELEKTIRACFETGGVHVIEAPLDYSENKTTLIDELQNKTPTV